ncbi:MAG: M20/M25/M40 family metallo-hydrolase [Candidatus Aminicenantes bacterium]|nr:M20/M25/M40 family metallo-hydrolase [Candidatus Aminicenantes bacterium]
MKQKRLLEILLSLIKIEALSQHEKPVADHILDFLHALNLKPYFDKSSIQTGSDTGNLICKVGNGGHFMLLAHMDTAQPTVGVNPQILADRITSDGTTVLGIDNRVGIAVILYALEKVLLEKNVIKDFTVCFTTCEESTLAGSLNLEIADRIKQCFIFDSSLRPGAFIYSSCGAKKFTVTIKGLAAHSGLAPEKGINSIAIAACALSQIKQGRIGDKTTVNIGTISGGSAVNVVPEKTLLTGEVRSAELGMVDEVIAGIKTIFLKESATRGAGLEFKDQWDFKPYNITPETEIYKDVLTVIGKVGLTPVPVASLAGSDANSLNGRGIQAINLGIGAQNPHGNDEFIFTADLIKVSEIALELMKKQRS